MSYILKVNNILKLQLKIAVVDFEKVEQKALQIVFPNIKIVGCFFHYSQALLDNAKKHKIFRRNQSDDELERGFIKLMIALVLLPANFIEEGFDLITKVIFNVEENEQLKTFINYYKRT
ncbi:PREDICTED: uncharacterized protein LOC108762222 [Trachymyrmex cornetzi]|uniref:uncharacterized protein LOC108762222 n=1 Tax=Trachymyrmex cornetzi TaxID=471704 RepID=UPI00084F5044|nr:PREDICTED: uncharacterized protein LOC108762222 [Trachymyrmex cornetzi]